MDYYVTFLRHGESLGNLEHRFQGQADYPLTEKGRTQARTLGLYWQSQGVTFDACISSPLSRARETAEIVCDILRCPLELDPLWMEINNGQLAGRIEQEIQDRLPPSSDLFTHLGETGESRFELYLRAGRAIQALLDRPPGRYLIVTHGGTLTMAMYILLGVPLAVYPCGPRLLFKNTSFTEFVYETRKKTWRMLRFERPHWCDSDPPDNLL